MKYVPGPAFGEFRGSQGNTTASRNRFGTYVRNRVNPVQPNTVRQLFVRNTMSDLSSFWRELTPVQMAAWGVLGAQIIRTNTLGQTYNLTGHQAYLMTNAARINMGEARIDDAPPLDTLPVILTLDVTADSALGGSISIAYTATNSPVGARLSVFATPGVSDGRTFFSKGEFRWLADYAGNVASPIAISAEWIAKYGTVVQGTKIGVLVQPWSPNRIPGVPTRAFDVVA